MAEVGYGEDEGRLVSAGCECMGLARLYSSTNPSQLNPCLISRLGILDEEGGLSLQRHEPLSSVVVKMISSGVSWEQLDDIDFATVRAWPGLDQLTSWVFEDLDGLGLDHQAHPLVSSAIRLRCQSSVSARLSSSGAEGDSASRVRASLLSLQSSETS
jgi:hypothetical protein